MVKFNGRDARLLPDRPDPRFAGYLFYGEDQAEVAARRDRCAAALLGGDDMALVRMDGQAARRDPPALADALRASGFFGGRPVVAMDHVTDGVTAAIEAAVEGLSSSEGVLVCSAKVLPTRSKLRVLFEKSPHLACAPVYDDPPDAGEIAELLSRAGAPAADEAGMAELLTAARSLDSGGFRQTIDKLGLYMLGDPGPVTAEAVEACAPPANDADADAAVNCAAAGDAAGVARMTARLAGQGVAPTAVAIAASRRFRQLHRMATARGGPDAAAKAMRPPLRGPRYDLAMGQLRRWPAPRLEQAMTTLTELELTLRSSAPAPQWAVLERALVRVAMMAGR
ncbi:DNA polymerase III subunit delta [Rhodovulum sp. DZ06]|uniref:DNA polymerase III subunit delta n=1 Tax=Rhodovulum sp. DZ06 TaxID=3425126 RepID=UPI003D3307A6